MKIILMRKSKAGLSLILDYCFMFINKKILSIRITAKVLRQNSQIKKRK